MWEISILEEENVKQRRSRSPRFVRRPKFELNEKEKCVNFLVKIDENTRAVTATAIAVRRQDQNHQKDDQSKTKKFFGRFCRKWEKFEFSDRKNEVGHETENDDRVLVPTIDIGVRKIREKGRELDQDLEIVVAEAEVVEKKRNLDIKFV